MSTEITYTGQGDYNLPNLLCVIRIDVSVESAIT